MNLRLLIVLVLGLNLSCSRLNNSHDERELRCGTTLAPKAVALMPVPAPGQVRAIRVNARDAQDVPLSPRGCVILDKPLNSGESLIITAEDQDQSWGKVLDSTATESFFVTMETLPRSEVALACPGRETLRDQIVFPLTRSPSFDPRFMRVSVTVEGSRDPAFPSFGLLPATGDALELALNAEDGAELNLRVKLVNFLKLRANAEQTLTCKVKVDRTLPDVSVVLGSSPISSEFLNPGEPVFFRVTEPSQVYFCWEKMGATERCTFRPWKSDANAPSGGQWTLRYYAEDTAGNRSTPRSLQKLITVASELEAIEGIYRSAGFQLDQGASLKALDTFLAAEKRRQQLPGELERKALEGASHDILRKAAFALGPRHEIQLPVGLQGMIMNPNGQIFLTYNPFGVGQLWTTDGQLLKTLSTGKYGTIKDAEWNALGSHFVTKNQGSYVPTIVQVWTANGEVLADLGEADGLVGTSTDSGMIKKVHLIAGRNEITIPQANSLIIYDYVKKSKRVISVPDGLRGYQVTPSGREIYIASGTISPNTLTVYRTDDLSSRPFGTSFGRITALEFTRDESRLVLVNDATVQLYNQEGILQWAKYFNMATWDAEFLESSGRKALLQLNSYQASRIVDLEGRVIASPESGSDHSPLFQLNATEWLGSTNARLYKFNSATETLTYLPAQEGITAIASQPNSTAALIGYESGQIAIWDRRLLELEYRSDLIRRVPLSYSFTAQFTPDSRHVIHCGFSGPFQVLGLDDFQIQTYGSALAGQSIHDDRCVFHEDTQTVSFVTKDGDQQTLNTLGRDGSRLQKVYAHADVILAPDGLHRVVREGRTLTFYKGDERLATRVFTSLTVGSEPRGFHFSGNGQFVLAFSDSGLEVWSQSGDLIDSSDRSGNEGQITADGKVLITTYLGYEFDVYQEGSFAATLQGGVTESIRPYDLFQKGRGLAVQTAGNILIYDLGSPDREPLKIEERRARGNIAAQPNGDLLAMGYYSDSTAKVWSARGTLLLNMPRFAGRPAFSADNQWLLLNGTAEGSSLVNLDIEAVRTNYCQTMQTYLKTRHSAEDRAVICPAL